MRFGLTFAPGHVCRLAILMRDRYGSVGFVQSGRSY